MSAYKHWARQKKLDTKTQYEFYDWLMYRPREETDSKGFDDLFEDFLAEQSVGLIKRFVGWVRSKF